MRQIHWRVDDHVATITIEGYNRFNPISSAMFAELADCFERVDGDPQVRVAILRGAGNENFSTGADLKETDERRARNNVAAYSAPDALARQRRNFWFAHERAGLQARMRMSRAPSFTPVIAALNGYCLAAAMIVAFAHSSIRIAGQSAKFGFAEIRFGGGQGLAMSLLPLAISPAHVQRLAFGDYINASEAYGIGMVNEVVPDDQVFARVSAIAERLAAAPRLAMLAERRGTDMVRQQRQADAAAVANSLSALVHLGLGKYEL